MVNYVIYDIERDKTRNKIVTACKDYGLTRIQYSVFVGELNTNKRQELFMRLRKILGKEKGKILVLPVCDKDIKLAKEIYQDPELGLC
ncbi:MAG: CRISPR-associated endonuclease Cas2 [Desulfitobacterium hafniense]|nr:CRISPR-associated endonuclease Cas2 [Desulfitobacterium hafniense]